MERKRKSNPWMFLLWLLWLLFAPGCAQFPDADSYDWCKKNLADDTLIEECGKEVKSRSDRAIAREDRTTKAECLWPNGVWVDPPGVCQKSNGNMPIY